MNIAKEFVFFVGVWMMIALSVLLLYASKHNQDSPSAKKMLDVSAQQEVVPSQIHFSDKKMNETSAMQERRKRRLDEACRRLGLRNISYDGKSLVGKNMLVNNEQKYIYCVVGKVASSTWKQVLLVGTGKISENRPQDVTWGQDGHRTIRYLPHLIKFSKEAIDRRLKSYYKFMFVRHPLERTLSAFRDKFRRQENYMSHFGRQIVRRFRGANASAESLRRGHDVTLAEYVRFLLDPSMSRATKADRTDIHWASQSDLCHPCSIDYDFIGHYETLDDDGDFLVRQLRLDPKAQFPHQYDADGRPKKARRVTDDDFREAFAEVAPDDFEAFKRLYANDYELFGYA